MATGRSKEEFLSFLDFLSEKGLVAKATAQSRKASANKVFAILEPNEAEDVTAIDLDTVMYRFSNLKGQEYTPQSLQTYKSRIRSALDDFESYRSNPLSFKPALQTRNRSAKKSAPLKSEARSTDNPTSSIPSEVVPPPAATVRAAPEILPIALRQGLTVQIAHLPFDLTKAEATKIANIILAHAMIED